MRVSRARPACLSAAASEPSLLPGMHMPSEDPAGLGTRDGYGPYLHPTYAMSLPSGFQYSSISMDMPSSRRTSCWTQLRSMPYPFVLYVLLVIGLFLIGIVNHRAVFSTVHHVAQYVRLHLGLLGLPLLMALVALTALPFAVGYGLAVFLLGITYRLPFSLLPAYVASLIGAAGAFVLCRRFLTDYVHRRLTSWPHFDLVREYILEHPVRVMVILRLAPVPFNLLNVLCAGLPVSMQDYMIAVAIVSLRVLLMLFVADAVADIATETATNPDAPTVSMAKWIELGVTLLFFVIFIIGSSLFYYVVKKRWDYKHRLSMFELEAHRIDHPYVAV